MTEFKPKVPDEEVNYDKEHPIKDVLSMLAIIIVSFGILLFVLDFSSRYIAHFVDLETEARIFNSETFAFLDKGKPQQEIDVFVNELWLPFDEERKISFHPSILNTSEPNAFMSVGGKLSITDGLLKDIKNRNGLAFVICHELGHFYHRHVIRRVGRGLGIKLLFSLAGIGDMKKVLNFAGQSFSRGDETEADKFAVSCVQKRFGHLKGFDEFFHLVMSKETALDKIPFLSTHPVTSSRLTNIVTEATKKGFSLEGPLEPFEYQKEIKESK